jgi:hypothetical protein
MLCAIRAQLLSHAWEVASHDHYMYKAKCHPPITRSPTGLQTCSPHPPDTAMPLRNRIAHRPSTPAHSITPTEANPDVSNGGVWEQSPGWCVSCPWAEVLLHSPIPETPPACILHPPKGPLGSQGPPHWEMPCHMCVSPFMHWLRDVMLHAEEEDRMRILGNRNGYGMILKI